MAQKIWILYRIPCHLWSKLEVLEFLEVAQIYASILLSDSNCLHMSIDQKHLCLSTDHWAEVKSLTGYLLTKVLLSRDMSKDKKAKKYSLVLSSQTSYFVSLHIREGVA